MICIACDHGGYELKEHLKAYMEKKGYEVKDLGCDSTAAVDYPVYGQKAGECVASGEAELGIIICGTGIGISIAANKVPGVRAALCMNSTMAALAREHNNANILSLGARMIGSVLAEDIVDAFLKTEFSTQVRHHDRVNLFTEMENKYHSQLK